GGRRRPPRHQRDHALAQAQAVRDRVAAARETCEGPPMRLVTYTFRGTTRLGALVGDAEVVDLNRACALHRAERGERRARALADFLVPPDMLAFLQAGDPAMDAARAALAHMRDLRTPLAGLASGLVFRTDEPGLSLEAPVPRPGKVLAVGVNYKDHAEEAKIPLPERPIIFTN